MKKKHRVKKAKVTASKSTVSKIAVPKAAASVVLANSSPPAISTHRPDEERMEMPPPEELLREAEEEPNYRDLSHYASVIGTLRKKGFSYRDIAEWFSERGVDVDHNAVYRVYTNSLSDYDAHLESEREDREAQEEAERNR
jgi:hypothetical protein